MLKNSLLKLKTCFIRKCCFVHQEEGTNLNLKPEKCCLKNLKYFYLFPTHMKFFIPLSIG